MDLKFAVDHQLKNRKRPKGNFENLCFSLTGANVPGQRFYFMFLADWGSRMRQVEKKKKTLNNCTEHERV